MGVESSADLAGMFSADDFAEAASFVAAGGGAAVACTVIVDRPREISDVGVAGIAQYNTTILVRRAVIAAPDGGTFSGAASFAGATFRVASAELDETGSIWTCQIQPTT